MGIPGLPGFGPKATAAVICRYGRMESIPVTDEPWDGIQIRGQKMVLRDVGIGPQELYRSTPI